MQLRFAQASARLGAPLSVAQQAKLTKDTDATVRRQNAAAAALHSRAQRVRGDEDLANGWIT